MVAFFVSMEWTGQQQIQFLLQSFLLGGFQGLFLDLITSLCAGRKRRRWLWSDVFFGPLAAVTTFCGALAIMDGQLHPLLFFGIALGMLTEHVTIGAILIRLVHHLRCMLAQIDAKAHLACAHFIGDRRSICHRGEKSPKNARKS